MPTEPSSPATFSLANSSSTQLLTFSIPAAFVCVSASLRVQGTFSPTASFNLLKIVWTVSGEEDDTPVAGGNTGATVDQTIPMGSGAIADINAAAGSNVTGTIGWHTLVSGTQLNVTSAVLTIASGSAITPPYGIGRKVLDQVGLPQIG